jgi:hypothetical protein
MYQRNEGFDTILVAPKTQALAGALGRATKAANLRCRSALVRLNPGEGEDLCRAVSITTEGFRQWLAAADGPRRDDHRSAVAVAWWTDRLGRRHVRVKGARWSFTYGSKEECNTLCPHPQSRPPLWMIYPELIYLADVGAGECVLAACPCGEVGTPEEIGWMGDCCAVCHDRCEEGLAVPAPILLHTPPRRSWTSLGDPISFSADGKRLARVMYDGAVLIHDLQNGETFSAEGTRPLLGTGDLAFLPDGRTVALTGPQSVLLLDTHSGKRREGPPAGTYLKRLTVSPDGNLIGVTASPDQFAVWNLRTNEPLFALSPRDGGPYVACAAFSPDGEHLVGGCADGTTRLWAAATGREVARWDGGPESSRGIVELAVSPDGRFLATLTDDLENNLVLRDLPKGAIRATWTLDRQRYHPDTWLRLIAFSLDSQTLAASERDGVLKFYDVASGPTVSLVSGPRPEAMALAFCPAGRWLATTGEGDWIKLWPWEGLLAAARRQGKRPAGRGTLRASSKRRKPS